MVVFFVIVNGLSLSNTLLSSVGSFGDVYKRQDESIYTSNYLIINAQALTNGKTIGSADRFTYSFSLRSQVATPTANPKDGEGISMGDSISLYCSTEGSRIFYTVNGSAPVVSLNGTQIVMGKDTYEFKDAPIEITDDIADYGSSLTITEMCIRDRL